MIDRAKLNRALKLLADARKSLELIEVELGDSQKPSEDQLRAAKIAEKGLCIFCEEPIVGDEPQFRGTHQRCYKKVNRAINSGEINDEQAVRRGWILPANKGGRPPGDVAIRLSADRERKRKGTAKK